MLRGKAARLDLRKRVRAARRGAEDQTGASGPKSEVRNPLEVGCSGGLAFGTGVHGVLQGFRGLVASWAGRGAVVVPCWVG